MWTRARIKQEAKNSLRRFGYWMPLLITFVVGLVSGGTDSGDSAIASTTITHSANSNLQALLSGEFSSEHFNYYVTGALLEISEAIRSFFSNPLIAFTGAFIIIIGFIACVIIAFGWKAFVSGPLVVGMTRYFMEHRGFKSKFSRLFWCFKRGRYLNVAKIMLVREIKVFLWSLLLFIPGIVKSYEYCMVPYILAENPEISCTRAFEISKDMTRGEKWKIFMLDVSFVGWRLLGLLCCCVGEVFVMPYIEATYAELYQVMREKAHGLNYSDYTELPGFFPEQE